MEFVGIFFESKISFLLEWIKQDNVGPALAAIITLVGMIIFSVAVINTIRELSLINRAIKHVGSRDEEGFAKDFNLIDQELSEIPRVGTAWGEFSETLIPPRFNEQKLMLSPCENTHRPHIYFNLEDLNIGPNFLNVFPSIFVGVGLSLTFLGLISALDEAVTAINSSGGDTGSMQIAIGNLLQISSAKFYASLFALFMSVFLTISLRFMTWKLASSLSKLNGKIEHGVRFLTPEQLALQANDILNSQLSQLTTFNTDLAMKIGNEIQSSLKESMSPIIQKLETMGGDLTQQNLDSIKRITNEVTEGIQSATADSMKNVAGTLDKISDKLGSLSDSLSNALSNFDVEFKELLDQLGCSLKESTSEIVEDIDGSARALSHNIGEISTDITELMSGLSTTIDKIATTGAEISKQGAEELSKQIQFATQDASEQIAKAGDQLASGFENSTSNLVSALDKASYHVERLEKGIIPMPNHLNDVNSRLEVSSAKLAEVTGQFSISATTMRTVLEPFADYAKEMRDSVQSISEVIESSSEKMSHTSEKINQTVAQLDSTVNAQIANFHGADEHLVKLLQSIEDSTGRVISQVNEFVTEIDQGMATSIGLLHESVNDLEEAINNTKDTS